VAETFGTQLHGGNSAERSTWCALMRSGASLRYAKGSTSTSLQHSINDKAAATARPPRHRSAEMLRFSQTSEEPVDAGSHGSSRS